ncbi:MAG: type II toxin-antitoxin system RelE/ParE family toxin [Candidatus Jacksonbacteria bacterium]
MRYQVVLKKAAQKNLARIDQRYKPRISFVLLELSNNPYLGKKLKGELRDFYSLRVWPYRIIYQIIKNKLIVFVVQIKHRQRAYG